VLRIVRVKRVYLGVGGSFPFLKRSKRKVSNEGGQTFHNV
jgi:hypothetical protein